MKLTEENYVGIAEQAIKELCSEKDQKGRLVGPVQHPRSEICLP